MRAQEFTQPYGYWIDKEGKVIPVLDRYGHDRVAQRLGFFGYEDMISSGAIRLVVGDPFLVSTHKPTTYAKRSLASVIKNYGPVEIAYDRGSSEYDVGPTNMILRRLMAVTESINESVTKNVRVTKQGRVIEYRDENGELHHDTRAALINPKGFHFYNHGVLYKRIDPNGDIYWYNENGQYHRDDGPAIEYSDGFHFYNHGVKYKTIDPDGDMFWYNKDGQLHRVDGPAVEYANGTKEYWIDDKRYTKKQFKEKTQNLTESVTKNVRMTKQGRVIEYRDENGELHHDTRAALINPKGFHFYNHGVLYKRIDPNGDIYWYNENGQYHREDGPANELIHGTKKWYQRGNLHREDGPAIERADGRKEWYQNNKRHRRNGPAVEWADGSKEWWIDGKNYSEQGFREKTQNLTESVTKNVRITKQGRVIEYRDENGELHHDRRAALINPNGFHFYNHGVLYKRIDPDGIVFWYNKKGQRHREDGPAIEWANGTREWFQNGKRHRLDGPAIERINGTKEWWQNGKRHRLNGPAVEHSDGTREWYQNGKLHNDDGPAVEYVNGVKFWYQNGKYHRLDGPAIERVDGTKEYWIAGRRYTEQEFKEKTQNLTESVTKNVRMTKQGRVTEYREENDSTFTHNGVEYDLNCALEAASDIPIQKVPVSELIWIVDQDSQQDENRINRADLDAPLLLTRWNGKLTVLDGWHRLIKAMRNKVHVLRGRVIPEEFIYNCRV